MTTKKTFLLCILDGVGLNPNPIGNAVALAKTPTLTSLFATYPHATLTTFGERVGLPAGQMGNSEVGHMNIGAGRVVEQWLVRINRELKEQQYRASPAWKTLTKTSGRIHVIGLFSDGGVHSSLSHLLALIPALEADSQSEICLHLITDGRDTSPQGGAKFLHHLNLSPRTTIATMIGRYFAMDRDTRWERTEKAYRLIVEGKGTITNDFKASLEASYATDVTDEFIEPLSSTGYQGISQGDAVLFFNFRDDRMRQIARALCDASFSEFSRAGNTAPAGNTLCFTEYDETLKLPVLFQAVSQANFLGEAVSTSGRTQLRIAETEKYPHVTYFLDGGSEKTLPGEERILIPSPRDVPTYDLKPEMSAFGITEQLIHAINDRRFDLIVVNYANGDMVGHTGKLDAAIAAVETVDTCLGRVLTALQTVDGEALIIADHGNCEMMINYEDGTPNTAHTTFPVPVIFVSKERGLALRADGALCDVAPTVLARLNVPVPGEMQGRNLLA